LLHRNKRKGLKKQRRNVGRKHYKETNHVKIAMTRCSVCYTVINIEVRVRGKWSY